MCTFANAGVYGICTSSNTIARVDLDLTSYISNLSYATEFATMAVSPFAEVLCFSALTSEPVTVRMDAIRGFPCAFQCLASVFASDIFATA